MRRTGVISILVNIYELCDVTVAGFYAMDPGGRLMLGAKEELKHNS